MKKYKLFQPACIYKRLSLFLLLWFGVSGGIFGEWVPEGAWDFKEKVNTSKPVYGGPFSAFGYLALKFYQNEIHPLRDSATRCPFYPTCSRFALESLFLYGSFWGALMTLDRLLIREHQDLEKDYETIEIRPDLKFFDPVARNFIFLKRL